MRRENADTYWLYVLVKKETPKAYLCNDGERDHWIPKSQIRDQEETLGIGVMTRIEVLGWLAEKNEFNVNNQPLSVAKRPDETETIRKPHKPAYDYDDDIPF